MLVCWSYVSIGFIDERTCVFVVGWLCLCCLNFIVASSSLYECHSHLAVGVKFAELVGCFLGFEECSGDCYGELCWVGTRCRLVIIVAEAFEVTGAC